jgi:hypothetical protein
MDLEDVDDTRQPVAPASFGGDTLNAVLGAELGVFLLFPPSNRGWTMLQ